MYITYICIKQFDIKSTLLGLNMLTFTSQISQQY